MPKSSDSSRPVRRYRERMRRAGLRLVQLWLPDTRSVGFAEECRRQSRRARGARRAESTALSWIDAARDTEGWTR